MVYYCTSQLKMLWRSMGFPPRFVTKRISLIRSRSDLSHHTSEQEVGDALVRSVMSIILPRKLSTTHELSASLSRAHPPADRVFPHSSGPSPTLLDVLNLRHGSVCEFIRRNGVLFAVASAPGQGSLVPDAPHPCCARCQGGSGLCLKANSVISLTAEAYRMVLFHSKITGQWTQVNVNS